MVVFFCYIFEIIFSETVFSLSTLSGTSIILKQSFTVYFFIVEEPTKHAAISLESDNSSI